MPASARPAARPAAQKRTAAQGTFTLCGVDPVAVETKFGLVAPPAPAPLPAHATALDTAARAQPRTVGTPLVVQPHAHFLTLGDDETRRVRVTMQDAMTRRALDGCAVCFWCRHAFATYPIGCPLRYVPHAVIKTCYSEITKETYHIRQDVPAHRVPEIATDGALRLAQPADYYETDGAFCSFNCAMAYINDHAADPRFRHSRALLVQIYNAVFEPTEPVVINPAPSWRLLDDYGGPLTIDAFRETAARKLTIDRGHAVSRVPKVAPLGHVFEEMDIF
jgi:hypothetical protein